MFAQEKMNPETKLMINAEDSNVKTKSKSSILRSFTLKSSNEGKNPEHSASGKILEYVSCCTKFFLTFSRFFLNNFSKNVHVYFRS